MPYIIILNIINIFLAPIQLAQAGGDFSCLSRDKRSCSPSLGAKPVPRKPESASARNPGNGGPEETVSFAELVRKVEEEDALEGPDDFEAYMESKLQRIIRYQELVAAGPTGSAPKPVRGCDVVTSIRNLTR
jgi:hypothetical protein